MGESEQAVMTRQNETTAGSTEQPQTTTIKPLRTKTQPPSALASLIPLFIPCDIIVLKGFKENSTLSRQDWAVNIWSPGVDLRTMAAGTVVRSDGQV